MTAAPHIDLAQRLEFLGITEEDRLCLKGLRPLFEAEADRFVATFYGRLLAFGPTRALLSNPKVRERLLLRQRGYMLSLAGSEIDESYVEDRFRIGYAHARVGVEPRWVLGAYSLYLRLLTPPIQAHFDGDQTRAERAVSALVKVLMLDAQLAMDAYFSERQEELEKLNRQLAEATRAVRRDYEVQSQELRETAERARAAEEVAAVATVAAGLAHQLGTPMGIIQGYAESLDSMVTSDEGHARLHVIIEQIERISDVIRTLLSVAQPASRGWCRVELGHVIQEALAVLDARLRQNGIVVETDLPDDVGVRGDSQRLQQLFLNLFLNAADAMPGGGTLHVSMSKSEMGEVAVRIRDTGKGIPPDVLERIFEVFFTTKPGGQGSGLGLVLARRIVEEHGGTIDVKSEAGRGAEFHLVLPCEAPKEA
jgi:signal transduction histidine kinase